MSTIPKRLGTYELQHKLGQGSVGEVWKGQDVELHRDVAVKIIHTDLQSDPQFMTRFAKEGLEIASLRHTNIVPIREASVSRSEETSEITAFIAMDYIEGQTLAQYLNMTSHRGLFPSISQILYLFTSLGVAIDYAHQKGIVHGNIRPGNILLNKSNTERFEAGEPMFTDFGLQRLLGSSEVVGSPVYMSPEQAKGQLPNNRSDIYALGVMLYEICTGVQPFRDESSVAIMMQHINTLPTPPSLINPNIPPALSEVILRAMAKDTATRFPIASLLATAIADACSIQPVLPTAYNRSNSPDDARSLSGPQTSILGVSQPAARIHGSNPSLPRIPTVSRPLPGVSAPYPAIARQQSMKQPAVQTPKAFAQAEQATKQQPGMNTANTNLTIPAQSTAAQSPITTTASTRAIEPISNYPRIPSNALYSSPYSASPSRPMPKLAKEMKKGLRFTDTPVYVVTAALLLLLLVIGSAITMNLILKAQGGKTDQQAKQGAVVDADGHVYFQDDALGHNDNLRIQLQNIPAPTQGKSYYAWLIDNNKHPRLLGTLALNGNTASLTYPGDNAHTNLLSIIQEIIITQENTNATAAAPGDTRLYDATFTTASSPHIRDILASTPELPGKQSVIVSMSENIKSMNDKAGSIVDSLQSTHDYGLAYRQAIRIIELIDGTAYARSSGDLPAAAPSLAFTRVGLLSSPTQKGQIDILGMHLQMVRQNAGNNTPLIQHAQNAGTAVTDLQNWVQKMRTYDVQLLKTTNLQDPALLSVALQIKQLAADAYTGRTIPPNDGPQPVLGSAGVYQAYIETQYMATLDLHKV